MIHTKLVVFRLNDEVLETIEGIDIKHDSVEELKTKLAILNHVSYHDIEVEAVDVYEQPKSVFSVGERGLQYINYMGNPQLIDGCRPSYNINIPEAYDLFLDCIEDKDFCNAITFTYI